MSNAREIAKTALLTVLWLAFVTVVAVKLGGCAYVPVVYQKGKEANDAMVNASVECICHACSIGSVRREFSDKPDAWTAICLEPAVSEYLMRTE